MAKSKLVQANRAIARAVCTAMGQIQATVTRGYTKIEDAFVDRYLTRQGETITHAKARLRRGHPGR